MIVATTESVQQSFRAEGGDIKSFTPQLTLELGTRISQVAFSSDESVLAISAEQGGGLALYDVNGLMQANKQSTFEMGTDGASIRALVPNPEAIPELFAVVTGNGQLLLANMKTQQFVNGVNGQTLKEAVSCVAWSPKGKELVAGLGNGAVSQMKPEGQPTAEIACPPGLEGEHHGKPSVTKQSFRANVVVSAILWIETHLFIVAHTPNQPGDGLVPASTYHVITRDKATNTCRFQKLPEVCSPFGLNRSPAFQFMQRLRDFQDLQDAVIVASTASQEVGLFTRSKKPLASTSTPDQIINVFTTTAMADDSRRAQLPMAEDMSSDTSPIGMVLDLTSKSNVHRPLPGEEIDESHGPLPGLLILNNLGVLSAWWVAYAESIRNGTHYPGLMMYAGQQQSQSQSRIPSQGPTSSFGEAPSASKPAFGASMFGQPTSTTAFGNPSQQAFGSSSALGTSTPVKSAAPTFGSSSSLGNTSHAFGNSSGLGMHSSPWGTPAQRTTGVAFGQPAFGNPSSVGKSMSPWASEGLAGGSAFGQTSKLGSAQGSTFGSSTQPSTLGTNAPPAASSGSGFANFANTGGFAAAAKGPSIFAQTTPSKSFTSDMDTDSAFTAKKDTQPVARIISSGFSVGSSWKNTDVEETRQANIPKQNGNSLFGGDFGKTLPELIEESSEPQSKDEEMSEGMSDDESTKARNPAKAPQASTLETTTPAQTPTPSKFFHAPPALNGSLETEAQKEVGPASGESSVHPPQLTATPIIKNEPFEEGKNLGDETPLPPEATSKATFTPTTSSAASSASVSKLADDAPLPPDFVPARPKAKAGTESAVEPSVAIASVDLAAAALPTVETAPLPLDLVKPKLQQPVPQTPTETPMSFLSPETKIKSHRGLPEELQALPEDDDDIDDEGSGVDVADEINDEPSPKVTPESSFGGKQDNSPIGGAFSKVTQPQLQQVQTRVSLFSDAGQSSVPVLPPPSKLQESPRSPSPVRSSIPSDLLRPDNFRSVSAPGVSLATGKPPLRRSMIQAPKSTKSFEQRQKDEQERLARERERQREEEEQSLSDQEDERIRRELESDIQGSTELEQLITHQDYVGSVAKSGIPAQIERLYRDINSMVDTLALNCRNLQAFIKGHSEMYRENGRFKDDLDSSKDWVLVEIEDLSTLENTVRHELSQGCLRDVDKKLATLRDLRKEVSKLHIRQHDLKRTVDALTDVENIEAHRIYPLSAEQSIQRHDLRKQLAEFQTTLSQVEEKISLLQAKLVSVGISSTSRNGAGPRVPTVEAVENTIRKMTSMVEKKSGDIDFLEKQMRKLNMQSFSAGLDSPFRPTSHASSREASPFVTPPTSAQKGRFAMSMSSVNGSAAKNTFFTPRTQFGNSGASYRFPDSRTKRKKFADFSKEDLKAHGERAARRREILGLVRDALVGKNEEKEVTVLPLR